MKTVLHVLTRPPEEWVSAILAQPVKDPGTVVEQVDLTGESPDYQHLLERVMAADAVVTW
jgi:hypothetical protein